MDDEEKQRILTVHRFIAGEKPEAICASLKSSCSWLYKWIQRHADLDKGWSNSLPRKLANVANRTSAEIEEIVKFVR